MVLFRLRALRRPARRVSTPVYYILSKTHRQQTKLNEMFLVVVAVVVADTFDSHAGAGSQSWSS